MYGASLRAGVTITYVGRLNMLLSTLLRLQQNCATFRSADLFPPHANRRAVRTSRATSTPKTTSYRASGSCQNEGLGNRNSHGRSTCDSWPIGAPNAPREYCQSLDPEARRA